MPMAMQCPYWMFTGRKGASVCEASEVSFRDTAVRRAYLRTFCASAAGWRRCPMAQALNEKYEKGRTTDEGKS